MYSGVRVGNDRIPAVVPNYYGTGPAGPTMGIIGTTIGTRLLVVLGVVMAGTAGAVLYYQSTVHELRTENRQLEAENRALRGDLRASRSELRRADRRLRELNRSRSMRHEELRRLTARLDRVERDLERTRDRLNATEDNLSRARSRLDAVTAENRRLERRYWNAKATVERLEEENQRLSYRVDTGVILRVSELEYEYYEGPYTSLPDFGNATADRTGTATDFVLPRHRDDNFAVRYTGSITVPANGTYLFYTVSDDGSRLFIDGQLVVDNGGTHPERRVRETVTLAEGEHSIRVAMFEHEGAQTLDVGWDTTGGTPRCDPQEGTMGSP